MHYSTKNKDKQNGQDPQLYSHSAGELYVLLYNIIAGLKYRLSYVQLIFSNAKKKWIIVCNNNNIISIN